MPRINPQLDSVIEDSHEDGVRVGIEYFHPNARQMVRDSGGTMWAVFTRGDRIESDRNFEQIGIARSVDGGGSWEIPTFYEQERTPCINGIFDLNQNVFGPSTTPSIAIDSNGSLHVLFVVIDNDFRGDATGRLYHTEYSGQCWSPAEPVVLRLPDRLDQYDDEVTTAAGMGGPSVAVDSLDRLHVVWTALSDELGTSVVYYSKKENDEWSSPYLVRGEGGVLNNYYASIDTDERNHAHIAWQDNFNMIHYAQLNSAGDLIGEQEFECEVNQVGACETPAIAVKGSNNIIIAWSSTMGMEFPNRLRHSAGVWTARYQSGWEIEQAMEYSAWEEVNEVTPFFDGDGNPHLVWTDDCFFNNPFIECVRNRGIESITDTPPRPVPGGGDTASVSNISPQIANGLLSRMMLARKIEQEPWERTVLKTREDWAFGTVSARYSKHNHNGGNVNIIHWDLGTPPFAANNYHIGLDVSLLPTPNRPPIADAGDTQIIYQDMGDGIIDVSDLSKFSSFYGTNPEDDDWSFFADFHKSDPSVIDNFDTEVLRAAWKSKPGDEHWNPIVDISPVTIPVVRINGGGSRDDDGNIIYYKWVNKTDGDRVLAEGPHAFVANIQLTSLGRHDLELTVTDDEGSTATDELRIYVNPPLIPTPEPESEPEDNVVSAQVPQLANFQQSEETDQVIVCFNKPLTDSRHKKIKDQFETFRSLAEGASGHVRSAKDDLSVLMQLYVAKGSVDEVKEKLEGEKGVEFVIPDHVVQAVETIPNDTDFSLLWGLRNTGQNSGTEGVDIKATEAWDITTGDDSIVVAIIDSGIDYNHPDLAANMWRNPDTTAADVYGADFSTCDIFNENGVCILSKLRDLDPIDNNGHGTHVAGTVGAIGDNDDGVTGVAWNVKLMAVKFLGLSGGGRTSDAIDAIRYAYENGAHIMNNSWGGWAYNEALEAVVRQVTEAGVIFVAAAGNNGHRGNPISYPASYDNVIGVGALDRNGNKTYFSNFGDYVDISAPGKDIFSTYPNNLYQFLDGTSMAAPHVSGVAALIKSAHPEWSTEKIINELVDGDCIADRGLVGPMLNAQEAIVDGIRGCPAIPPVFESVAIDGDVERKEYFLTNNQQIATDTSGQMWAVYTKTGPRNQPEVHFSQSMNGGRSWLYQDPIFQDGAPSCLDGSARPLEPGDEAITFSHGATIAADSRGGIHVVFIGSGDNGNQIYHIKRVGSCWSKPERVTLDPDQGAFGVEESLYNPDLAIDGRDHLHVVWPGRAPSSVRIYYTVFDGIDWRSPITVANDGHYVSIDVDEYNRPHVAFENLQRQTFYAKKTPLGFESTLLFSASDLSSSFSNYPVIAVGGSNNINVTYIGDDRFEPGQPYLYQNGVWISKWNGREWSHGNISGALPYADPISPPTIVVDARNKAHIIWNYQKPVLGETEFSSWHWSEESGTEKFKTRQTPIGIYNGMHSFWNSHGGKSGFIYHEWGQPKNELVYLDFGVALAPRRGSPQNNPPIALAAYLLNSGKNENVSLDGTGSTDPDSGDIIELYRWTDSSTGKIIYVGPHSLPEISLDPGHYNFNLRVSDGVLWSEPDNLSLMINDSLLANAGRDQVLEEKVGDSRVSFGDIGIVARALDSFPGHERWNPYADVWASDPPVIDELDFLAISAAHGAAPEDHRWARQYDVYPKTLPKAELNATGSSTNGIINYTWIDLTRDNQVIYSGQKLIETGSISGYGDHTIQLTVEDNQGNRATDSMVVTVNRHQFEKRSSILPSPTQLLSQTGDGEINFSDFILYYAVNQTARNISSNSQGKAFRSSANIQEFKSMGEFIRAYGKKSGEVGYNNKFDISDIKINQEYDRSLKNDHLFSVEAGPDLDVGLVEQIGGSYVAQAQLSGMVYKNNQSAPKFHKLTWFVDQCPQAGCAKVSFSGRDLKATASFSVPGRYRLGLVAWDDLKVRVSYLNVVVDSNGRVIDPDPGQPGSGDSNEIAQLPGLRTVFNPNDNQTGEVSVQVSEPGHAELKIYDQLGQMIGTLANKPVSQGRHVFEWTGRDFVGNVVPSGAYRIIGNISGKALKTILVVTR